MNAGNGAVHFDTASAIACKKGFSSIADKPPTSRPYNHSIPQWFTNSHNIFISTIEQQTEKKPFHAVQNIQ